MNLLDLFNLLEHEFSKLAEFKLINSYIDNLESIIKFELKFNEYIIAVECMFNTKSISMLITIANTNNILNEQIDINSKYLRITLPHAILISITNLPFEYVITASNNSEQFINLCAYNYHLYITVDKIHKINEIIQFLINLNPIIKKLF